MKGLEDLSHGLAWARVLVEERREDPELPLLLTLTDGTAARDWWARRGAQAAGMAGALLERCEVLRYRPGRRCTVRFHLECPEPKRIYVKLHRPSRARRIAQCLGELDSFGHQPDLALPPFLGFLQEEGILLLGELPGSTMEEQIALGTGNGFPAAGRAISRFHDLPAKTPRAWSAEDELDVVARHLPGLERAAGAGRIEETYAGLVRAADSLGHSHIVLLHRDLHPQQILLDQGRAGFVDLDDIARGPAEIDVGNLLAHLDLMEFHRPGDPSPLPAAKQGLLEGYAGNGRFRRESLDAAHALALFRLAGIQTGRPELGDLWLRLLERAEAVLRGAGSP